eukprot:COSAG06_NODE_3503_length_5258_cov_19.991665_3_plen_47_part_00
MHVYYNWRVHSGATQLAARLRYASGDNAAAAAVLGHGISGRPADYN